MYDTLAPYINDWLDEVVIRYGNELELLAKPLLSCVVWLEQALLWLDAPWFALLLCTAVFTYTRRWSIVAWTAAAMVYVQSLGLWEQAMQTLALMLTATGLSVLIGLPLGIASGLYPRVSKVLRPILDVMQTMPSFVYLIPALMLFGLGKVPAILATVVYTVPPMIRLTELGIRTVPKDNVEAGLAFGANPWQLLWEVQLPLALPQIRAGLNQTIMLSLSMVVIASMIGARGLGEEVLLGIQRLDVGRGLLAGFAIVLIAIVLDRLSQATRPSSNSTDTARA